MKKLHVILELIRKLIKKEKPFKIGYNSRNQKNQRACNEVYTRSSLE